MGERPWYKHYSSNFILGTMDLSLEERGAYIIVLDLMYDRDGYVHDDPLAVARILNCSVRKWSGIRERLLLLGKLETHEGNLTNHKALAEIEKARDSMRKLAENGSKGGQKQAENRFGLLINKDLGQAPLKHTRKKEIERKIEKGTQRVDRQLHPRLFAACEAATGVLLAIEIKGASFPRQMVGEALAGLGGKWC